MVAVMLIPTIVCEIKNMSTFTRSGMSGLGRRRLRKSRDRARVRACLPWSTALVTVSRPVSGILSTPEAPVAIHLCGLPEGAGDRRTGRPCPLLGLAPGGVCRAARVAPDAGALLPHRFTLTCDRSPGPSAVSLCCTVRQVTPTWLSPAPCPVESRLSSTRSRAPCRGHPADSPSADSATTRSESGFSLVHERVEARRVDVHLQPCAVLVAGADDDLSGRKASVLSWDRSDGRNLGLRRWRLGGTAARRRGDVLDRGRRSNGGDRR